MEAETTTPKKKIDLNKPAVKKAIEEGQAVLKDGKSKADAAWAIYSRLKDEDEELIVAAFIKGATLTEKGGSHLLVQLPQASGQGGEDLLGSNCVQ